MFRRFFRHIKDGFQGLFRNFGMSFSSIIAVTITLLLVGAFVVLTTNINSISNEIQDSVSMIVFVEDEYKASEAYDEATDTYTYTPSEKEVTIEYEINAVQGVENVKFNDRGVEFDYYISQYEDNKQFYLDNYRNDNPFNDVYEVTVKEGFSFDGVKNLILKIDGVSKVEDGGETTYTLLNVLTNIRDISLILVIALVVLATFLIYNTIKITIQARENEITIMRYVGARNSYIRGPFLVEGVVIGFLGSVVPILTIIFGYNYIADGSNQFINAVNLIEPFGPFTFYNLQFNNFLLTVSLFIAAIGMVVGFIGSYISVIKTLRGKR